jgi:hypothetical protein
MRADVPFAQLILTRDAMEATQHSRRAAAQFRWITSWSRSRPRPADPLHAAGGRDRLGRGESSTRVSPPAVQGAALQLRRRASYRSCRLGRAVPPRKDLSGWNIPGSDAYHKTGGLGRHGGRSADGPPPAHFRFLSFLYSGDAPSLPDASAPPTSCTNTARPVPRRPALAIDVDWHRRPIFPRTHFVMNTEPDGRSTARGWPLSRASPRLPPLA